MHMIHRKTPSFISRHQPLCPSLMQSHAFHLFPHISSCLVTTQIQSIFFILSVLCHPTTASSSSQSHSSSNSTFPLEWYMSLVWRTRSPMHCPNSRIRERWLRVRVYRSRAFNPHAWRWGWRSDGSDIQLVQATSQGSLDNGSFL